jgi:hypothetical protein
MRRWRKLSKSQPPYLVVKEFNARGMIHFHCLVRGSFDEKIIRRAYRSARAYADGYEHRFGSRRDKNGEEHGLQLQFLPRGAAMPRRKYTGYLTKYLTKSLAEELADRRRPDCDYPHLPLPAVDGRQIACDCQPCSSARRYKSRASDMFGFTGHVMSKSSAHGSKWGTTFGEARAKRAQYRSSQAGDISIVGWEYVGAGYNSSKADQRWFRMAAKYRYERTRPPPAD